MLTFENGELVCVMGPGELPYVSLPGRQNTRKAPRLPRKNVYHAHMRNGSKVHTLVAVGFWRSLALQLCDAGHYTFDVTVRNRKVPQLPEPLINKGWLALRVLAIANRKNRGLDDVIVPDLDSDACISPLMDSLTTVGIIDDDARIVDVQGQAVHSQNGPALTFMLSPVDDPAVRSAEMLAIARAVCEL